MALFGKKKEIEEKKDEAAKKPVASVQKSAVADRDLARVLIRPLITEKAAMLGEQNVQTFVIHQHATKRDVADAIKTIYSVTPKKVRIVRYRPAVVRSGMRGTMSKQSGLKKAYVYLKEGDRIELV